MHRMGRPRKIRAVAGEEQRSCGKGRVAAGEAEELLNKKSCHRNTAGKTEFLRQLFLLLQELYNDYHDPDDHVESHSNV